MAEALNLYATPSAFMRRIRADTGIYGAYKGIDEAHMGIYGAYKGIYEVQLPETRIIP